MCGIIARNKTAEGIVGGWSANLTLPDRHSGTTPAGSSVLPVKDGDRGKHKVGEPD